MDGFIYMTLVILIVGCVILFLPVMGFIYIFSGEYWMSLLYFLPFLGVYGVILYRTCVALPECRRQKLLREKYNYPSSIDEMENADQWHKGFFNVINDRLAITTEDDKQEDLKRCQQVVKKMTINDAFSKFHKAFRLTGCHMEIKDSSGQTVVKIV